MIFPDSLFQKKPDTQLMLRKRDINGLIRVLSSRDPDVQASAVHGLGTIGTDATCPLLTALRKKQESPFGGHWCSYGDRRSPSSIFPGGNDPGSLQ